MHMHDLDRTQNQHMPEVKLHA